MQAFMCAAYAHFTYSSQTRNQPLFNLPRHSSFFMYGCSRRPAPRRVKFLMAAVDGESATSQFLPDTHLLSCTFTNHTLHYFIFFIC